MLAHQRHGRLGAQERPGEIDLQHPPPVRIGRLQQRREHRDPGIVDQRVEPAKTPFDLGDRAGHRPRIGDIAMQPERIAGSAQCRHAGPQQFALDVEQRHPPALGEKAFCHRKPDAARGAGHQGDFLKGRGHSAVHRLVVCTALSLARARSLCFLNRIASARQKGGIS
jgi:hypothetical protein